MLLNAITLYAVRYCLGRRTYAVDDCRQWVLSVKDELTPETRRAICRDISECDDLGDDCDKRCWRELLSVLGD